MKKPGKKNKMRVTLKCHKIILARIVPETLAKFGLMQNINTRFMKINKKCCGNNIGNIVRRFVYNSHTSIAPFLGMNKRTREK